MARPTWPTRSPARPPTRRSTSLRASRGMRSVRDVRVKGAIGVVELDCIDDLDALRRRFVAAGVFVRPFGSVVYLTPALTIRDEELSCLMRAVCEVLSERAW